MRILKLTSVAIAAAMTMGSAVTAYADLEASATSHVYAIVSPNISMGAAAATVNAGSVQTGDLTALVTFRVDANNEDIDLACNASHLFKGNVPLPNFPTILPDEVAPIMLDVSAGCTITPDIATPTSGQSSTLAYGVPIVDVDGFPGLGTAFVNYESAQNGHFSQDVVVEVHWVQDDPEKPQGEYSGNVKLLGMIPI